MDLQKTVAEYNNRLAKKTCTIKELALITDLSYAKALQLSRMKGFPVIQIGKNKRVILSKLDEFLESLIGEEL